MKDQSIDNETVGNEQEKKVSTGIEPTGIAPCAIYGVHRMIAQGGAHTYDYKTKNTIKYLAHFYKCKCGEKVVCEGQPDSQFYDPLYNYVTEGGIKDAAGYRGSWAVYVDSSKIFYSSKNYIDGYKFYMA